MSVVYVVRSGIYIVYFLTDGSFIKIGYTSRTLKQRLRELNTGSSSPLYILGYIQNGDLELEKKLHMQFPVTNLEWHKSTSELIEFINDNNNMNVYVDWIDGRLMPLKKMKIVN